MSSQYADGAPLDMFASMRGSRGRARLRGDVQGFNAAKHVWTCKRCGFERYESPYVQPGGGSRAYPALCTECGERDWTHSDSKAEARRYAELRQLEKAGQIMHLKHPAQPLKLKVYSVHTGEQVTIREYTADFWYEEKLKSGKWGSFVYEDHKPREKLTKLAALIHEMVWHQHGVRVRISWYKNRRIQVKG